MNKAFVRDPEPQDPTCPEPKGCGTAGIPVDKETLVAQLSDATSQALHGQAYYCPSPGCHVAYFDAIGGIVALDEIARPAHPKPDGAPLCHCLGVHADEIIEEAKRGCRDRIRRIVAEAEQNASRCAKKMPSGRPCATEARRLFMAHFKPR